MGPDDIRPPHGEIDPDGVMPPERWARLDDYFADRLPLADRVEMERWIAEHDERRRLIAQVRELWRRAETAAPELGPVDIRQVLNTLAAKREAMDAASRNTPASVIELSKYQNQPRTAGWGFAGRVSRRRRAFLLGAAAAALMVAVALPIALRRASAPAPVAQVPPSREIVTKRAQQATLDLADGSRVVLAAGSTLRIPGDFNVPSVNGGGTRRELYLEGKAYFEVTHDSTRPFIVRTATAVTEDLGTEFVIRAYPESRATQVAVVSGLVEMRATSGKAPSSAALRLEPGDVARVDSGGGSTVARNVALASFVSWTRGVLAFDGVPVREALAELSRWYDVDFELRDRSRDTLRISGEFRDEPVSQAMQRLALMLDVRATRVGGTVHLSPVRGTRAEP